MKNENDSFEVTFKNKYYDIQKFLKNHPGGINYLLPYKQKDVSTRMEKTQHSKAALYLLKEYKNESKTENNQEEEEEEEDLEKLVDWNKPMLSQVGSLGANYNKWVVSPVDRPLRLFENPILENLTITPWYVVPMVWIPIIIYLTKLGTENYIALTKGTSSTVTVTVHLALGVSLWTLLEYSLHRWVFHMEPTGHSKAMIYIHFAIHGLHHKVPFDTKRLVFPPFPAAIIAITLYEIFSLILPESSIILITAGALLGYLTYDMIHYYLHYGSPNENSYLYNLKRYHNQHHFAHQDSGFGISSVFWDKIFGTAIRLRQLSMGIRW